MDQIIKRYRMTISGFGGKEFTAIETSPAAAVATVIKERAKRGSRRFNIEQWPDDPDTYEVSSDGHRVATVKIVGIDE